jgi:AsmA protein
LLDAVKDLKTRDAVKSVIERFTGGGMRPVPDAPAAAPAADAAAKPN